MMNPRFILGLRYNQDSTNFAVAAENGFKIFHVDPLVEKARANLDAVGGLSIVEMLDRTNILALVSGGNTPKYPENAVILWDESRKEDKLVAEIICAQPVLSVKLANDKIVVVLRNQIHIFSFPNPITKLKTFETRDNPRGLCELSKSVDKQLLVFPAPGHTAGCVQVLELNENSAEQTKTINAHKAELACLAVNYRGTLIATASREGTRVKVFDLVTKRDPKIFRRGLDTATIYCISFSHDSAFLCVSSDKGTVHIFALDNMNLNRKFSDSFVKVSQAINLTYAESVWSYKNFTVASECPCIVAFGKDSAQSTTRNSVIALCVDGTYHKYVFMTEKDDRPPNREAFGLFYHGTGDDIVF